MIAFGVHINNNNNVMFVVRSVGRGGRRAARDLLRRSIFHENDRKECKSPAAAATADGRPDARGCARLRHRPIDLRYSACHVIIMYIIYYIDTYYRIIILLYIRSTIYGCRKCALRTNVCFSFATMYLNNKYAQHKTFWCAYSKYIIVGII